MVLHATIKIDDEFYNQANFGKMSTTCMIIINIRDHKPTNTTRIHTHTFHMNTNNQIHK